MSTARRDKTDEWDFRKPATEPKLGRCEHTHRSARFLHVQATDCVNWREGESAPAQPCTCVTTGSAACKFPHLCRTCYQYHPGVSCYWHTQGKTPADKRADGRTFVRSNGSLGCGECCFGDRCDDHTHSSRDNCRYCLGSGSPAEAVPPAAETAHTRNSEVLADFVKYCEAHPDHRFWQALRNWSGYHFVFASDMDYRDLTATEPRDTFNWEGRRHDK